MPQLETTEQARRRLIAWYFGSLRPRLLRAIGERRVSVGSAWELDRQLRGLLAQPAAVRRHPHHL